MRQVGGKDQGIAFGQPVALSLADPDGDRPGQDEQELLAGMGVGAVARGTWREVEQLRLEQGGVVGKLLDADRVVAELEAPPPPRARHATMPARPADERGDRGPVGARQPLQAGDSRHGGAALDGADQARREPGALAGRPQREAPRAPQVAQHRPIGACDLIRAGRAENAPDSRRVDPLDLPHALDLRQPVEVRIGVEPVASGGSSGADEALPLPEAQGGGRDADDPGRLADAMTGSSRSRIRTDVGEAHGSLAGRGRRLWRCIQIWTPMKASAMTKMRVPSTFTSGGTPSRLTPKTQSGKVTVLPATKVVIT